MTGRHLNMNRVVNGAREPETKVPGCSGHDTHEAAAEDTPINTRPEPCASAPKHTSALTPDSDGARYVM